MMEIILWIIFGGVVGWVASMIMGTDRQQGALANIFVGIVGALIGGFIAQALVGQGVTGFNFLSFVIALAGAVLLIGIVRLFTGQNRNNQHTIQ